jgi:hypothetical protein
MAEPWRRDVEMNHLHPVCRERVQGVLDACAREGIPFRMFEGYRSPHRQQYLYEQGRTRPEAIVTHAGPWSSIHQYGLAADFVLFENGGWSWDTSGSKEDWWSRLHEIGREYGMEPLSWEMPHLQMSRVSLSDLKAGQYPGGGDLFWAECLESAIVAWTGVPASPAVPDLVPERPPLDPGAAGPPLPEFVPPPAADWLPLYEPDISVMIGAAAIARRRSRTGDDPILVSAAYNAGGVYKSPKNPWCLRSYGDHLDRAAKWYGDASAVLKENM